MRPDGTMIDTTTVTSLDGTARPRAGRFSIDPLLTAALLAALPAVLVGLRANPGLMQGALINPDSAMRLVRLNDIVNAGAPLHAVMRDGSGGGTILHWSHFLDSLLLLLAAPLAPLLGWPAALHAAGLASGPLAMAGLGAALAWAAAPASARGWLWTAGLATAGAPVLLGYGALGVVHHHILLAAAVAMAAGWAHRIVRAACTPGTGGLAGGLALGACMAAGLWLSPETLPFTFAALGALWAAWFASPTSRPLAHALVAASAAYTALTAFALLVDPPAASLLAAEPDRISAPFVLLGAGALAASLVALGTGSRLRALACGVAAAVSWLILFPAVRKGTHGLMAPDQAAAFFTGINEMLPVSSLRGAVEHLFGGAASVLFLLLLARRQRGAAAAAAALVLAALAIAAAVALTSLHVRFAAYPVCAAAALLPILLTRLSRSSLSPGWQAASRSSALTLGVCVPFLVGIATPSHAVTGRLAVCHVADAAPLLAPYSGAIVLAHVNHTPDLLYATRARTVGSLYHRNPEAYVRLHEALRSVPSDTAPGPLLEATAATHLLACPGSARTMLLEGLPRTTLLDRVNDDHPPAWLRRVGGGGGWVLYAIGDNS